MEHLSVLEESEYLGRIVMFGRSRDNRCNVIAYAATGRSVASRSRILRFDARNGTVSTEVANPDLLRKNYAKLLLYPCIQRLHDTFLVSNGTHTKLLYRTASKQREDFSHWTPMTLLVRAFSQPYLVEGMRRGELIDLTHFEHDPPNWTPRIGGVMRQDSAAICMVKRVHGEAVRSFFEIPLQAGRGFLLSTYAGQNVPEGEPVPPFLGEPRCMSLEEDTAQELAENFYRYLGPKEEGEGIFMPGQDFRVGVVVIFFDTRSLRVETHIINRLKQRGSR